MNKFLNTSNGTATIDSTDVFTDPVAYLKRFGIDAVLIEPIEETALPAAA